MDIDRRVGDDRMTQLLTYWKLMQGQDFRWFKREVDCD